MKGSSLSDVWIESGILGPNSTGRAMIGKDYNKAMRVHKLTSLAVWRILFPHCLSFMDTHDQEFATALKSHSTGTSQEIHDLITLLCDPRFNRAKEMFIKHDLNFLFLWNLSGDGFYSNDVHSCPTRGKLGSSSVLRYMHTAIFYSPWPFELLGNLPVEQAKDAVCFLQWCGVSLVSSYAVCFLQQGGVSLVSSAIIYNSEVTRRPVWPVDPSTHWPINALSPCTFLQRGGVSLASSSVIYNIVKVKVTRWPIDPFDPLTRRPFRKRSPQ